MVLPDRAIRVGSLKKAEFSITNLTLHEQNKIIWVHVTLNWWEKIWPFLFCQTTADTNLRGVSPDSDEIIDKKAAAGKKKKTEVKKDKAAEEEKPLDRPTEEGNSVVNMLV